MASSQSDNLTNAPGQPAPGSGAASGAVDTTLVQAQLAALVEADGADLRPALEYIRALLNARVVALIPTTLPGNENSQEGACIVTTRGILASSVAQLAASLGIQKTATVQAAPELGQAGHTFAVPVFYEKRPVYLLLVQMVLPNPVDVRFHFVFLQTIAGFILYGEQRKSTARLLGVLEKTSAFLEVFRRVGLEGDQAKAYRIAMDGLAGIVGCSRVFVGLKVSSGLRLKAVSGVGKIDPKSLNHHPYEAAMREALDGGDVLSISAGDPPQANALALEILQQRTSAAHLAVVPLAAVGADAVSGAVLFEWAENEPPAEGYPQLLKAVQPFLPALFSLLERRGGTSILAKLHSLWRQASKNRRRAFIGAGVALAVLVFLPVPFKIKARCVLVPTLERVVAAPFTGELREALVRPGDSVTKGQPLADMDNRDLKLREAELVASRERAFKQRDRAMSNGGEGADYAQSQVAQLEAQSIDQELQLVRRKIALLSIASPLDGVVVSGDLRRAKGVPVQQGQVLFAVAPLEEMIIEIEVPDREVSHIAAEMPVSVRLEAFSGKQWTTRLERVHPQAEGREGRNVFVCEAAFKNPGGGINLRPGMRGRAVVDAGIRPLGWVLTYRLWDLIITTLFW